jgi:hypothetical protein
MIFRVSRKFGVGRVVIPSPAMRSLPHACAVFTPSCCETLLKGAPKCPTTGGQISFQLPGQVNPVGVVNPSNGLGPEYRAKPL